MTATYTPGFYDKKTIARNMARLNLESLWIVEITDFDGETEEFEISAMTAEQAAEEAANLTDKDIYTMFVQYAEA